jgi:hypothetical protein
MRKLYQILEIEQTSRLTQFIEEADIQEQVERKFKKLKQKVIWEMQNHPATKGNDQLLEYYIKKDFYGVRMTFREFKDLMKLPTGHDITRCRQLINEKGVVIDGKLERFMPSKEHTSERRALANMIRESMARDAI